jgi:hypothetical protein
MGIDDPRELLAAKWPVIAPAGLTGKLKPRTDLPNVKNPNAPLAVWAASKPKDDKKEVRKWA